MSVASFHRLTVAQPNLSHDPHRHHAHAFEAIAATLPLDSMGYEPAKREGRSSEKSPAEAGPSVRVFAEEGVLVFRNWAIQSAGIGSFGENARHRSVAAEQQIGRHRHSSYDHLSSPRFIGMNSLENLTP